jgi:hypothetical protein
MFYFPSCDVPARRLTDCRKRGPALRQFVAYADEKRDNPRG